MTPQKPENDRLSLSASVILRRVRTVSFTRFDQEGLLVVPKQNWQLVLNGVAADAFELVDGGRSIENIAKVLAESYPDTAPGTIAKDLLELFEDLVDKGAVEILQPA